jgi:hypothetical protein
MIDFIIPSIARPTLNRTLKSIQEQQFMFAKDKNWNVFVGFDGISATNIEYNNLIQDDKFNFIFFEEKLGKVGEYGIGNAGIVRNEIIKKVNSPNKWIAFVDDDDTLTPYYIDSLSVELENSDPPFDVCVFRMRYDPGGERILPPIMNDELEEDKVGISFCVKKDFIKKHNIKFVNDIREDFKFLMDLKNAGAVIKVSKYVTYNVGF